MLCTDEDENVLLPDAAEKFDELLTRWLLVQFYLFRFQNKNANIYFIHIFSQNSICVCLRVRACQHFGVFSNN